MFTVDFLAIDSTGIVSMLQGRLPKDIRHNSGLARGVGESGRQVLS